LQLLSWQVAEFIAVAVRERFHRVIHLLLVAVEELLQRREQIFFCIQPVLFEAIELGEQVAVVFFGHCFGLLRPGLHGIKEGIDLRFRGHVTQLLAFVFHGMAESLAGAAGIGAGTGLAKQIPMELLEGVDLARVVGLLLADRHAAQLAAVAQRFDHFPIAEQLLLPQFQLAQPVKPSDEGERGPLAPAIGAPLKLAHHHLSAEPITTALVAEHLGEHFVLCFRELDRRALEEIVLVLDHLFDGALVEDTVDHLQVRIGRADQLLIGLAEPCFGFPFSNGEGLAIHD